MKKFTIIFSVFLVLLFAGTMIYVAMSPDFVKPSDLKGEEDPDAPVWGMKLDDLIAYLEEKGLVSGDRTPLSAGVGSEAFSMNGAEFYWWDLENLSEGSDEYAAYKGMMEDGQIDLWGMGMYFMAVTKNGPFGLYAGGYEGNVKDLLAAYEAFGH